MKGTKKIFALLAAGIFCMPAMVQARHAAQSSTAVTVVHTESKLQQVKEGADTKILNRIKNILQSRDKQEAVNDAPELKSGFQGLTSWDMESHDEGGTLLFSDSPEYVTQHGIL